MTDRKSFGNILKLLRNNKGLSQRQLAKKLNVAPSTLAMYELNKREPDYETLGKIADFFDVNTDYLLGRSANPYPIEKLPKKAQIIILGIYLKKLRKPLMILLSIFILNTARIKRNETTGFHYYSPHKNRMALVPPSFFIYLQLLMLPFL